jgi:hypothetical protein
MNNTGFYSIVQFCPDVVRGEAVNVGVIVGSSALGMRVRMAERNELPPLGAPSHQQSSSKTRLNETSWPKPMSKPQRKRPDQAR